MRKFGQQEKLGRMQLLSKVDWLPAPASVIVIRFVFVLEFEIS
jgi:hypothetical protein